MYELFNREIIIHGYTIEDSKCYQEKGNGKCLYLQITFEGKRRIVFTSSITLQKGILQRKFPDDFPISTTIVKRDKNFIFT